MPQANDAASAAVSPFFIVRDVEQSLAFYRDHLGFEVTYLAPNGSLSSRSFDEAVRSSFRRLWARASVRSPIASGIPGRAVTLMSMFPIPTPWRASSRRATSNSLYPLGDTDDGLRGFELKDRDGYTLFFGLPS